MRGQKYTTEVRAKISLALRQRYLSKEARKKLGAAMSAALKGRVLSPKHRAHIGKSIKATLARKRLESNGRIELPTIS
jgi:hypothetical protein